MYITFFVYLSFFKHLEILYIVFKLILIYFFVHEQNATIMHTVGICLKHFVCVCLPFCSISATMLTCRTPPQPSPSQHKVQLHIDGVIREAPVSYTYNENPHISSVQPKHSFIRSALQPTFSYLTCA